MTDRALEADAGGRPVEEVRHDLVAFRGRFLAVVAVNITGFPLIIVDMVLKPF